MQWLTSRLFELLGGWVERVDDPADAVWLATLSRHLGWHVAAFAEVMPDSVLLADERAVVPAEPALVDALVALTDTSDPVGVAAVLVGQLIRECAEIITQCDLHADESLRRAVAFLMIDLASAQANVLRPVAKDAETFRMVAPVV
jgi:hypothetical protein